MRAMSEAIEGARDFQGFMEKVVADEKRLVQQVAGLPPRTEPTTPHGCATRCCRAASRVRTAPRTARPPEGRAPRQACKVTT